MNAPTDWWKTFFDGLAVGFWRAAVPPEATRADVDFLWKHLKLAPGARVLDVPCGAGRLHAAARRARLRDDRHRHLAGVSRRGGRGRVRAGPRRRLPMRADMRDLPRFTAISTRSSASATASDTSTTPATRPSSRPPRRRSSPGGRFAIDFGQTAEGVFPRFEPRLEGELHGYRFLEETRFDPVTSRIENVFEFSKDGRTESESSRRSASTWRATSSGCSAARVSEVVGLYGSPAEEPFALSSQRLLIVAEKPRSFLTRDTRLMTDQEPSRTIRPAFFASTANHVRMTAPEEIENEVGAVLAAELPGLLGGEGGEDHPRADERNDLGDHDSPPRPSGQASHTASGVARVRISTSRLRPR